VDDRPRAADERDCENRGQNEEEGDLAEEMPSRLAPEIFATDIEE